MEDKHPGGPMHSIYQEVTNKSAPCHIAFAYWNWGPFSSRLPIVTMHSKTQACSQDTCLQSQISSSSSLSELTSVAASSISAAPSDSCSELATSDMAAESKAFVPLGLPLPAPSRRACRGWHVWYCQGQHFAV